VSSMPTAAYDPRFFPEQETPLVIGTSCDSSMWFRQNSKLVTNMGGASGRDSVMMIMTAEGSTTCLDPGLGRG